MNCTVVFRTALCLLSLSPACVLLAEDSKPLSFTTQRWEMGVTIDSPGTCTGIVVTLPIPMDWPEQRVRTVSEHKTKNITSVRERVLSDGVKQMVISISRLSPGERAEVLVTMDIYKRSLPLPADTLKAQIPASPSRELRTFLGTSPSIETTHARIRGLAEEIVAKDTDGWATVRSIYDWVQANIKYEFDEELKGALAALESGQGDCEELTSLFIALCRNNKIPARSVWVPGHCYPEFYLENSEGRGRWFPCQSAGHQQFGEISEARPILQKGDDFRLPGESKSQRYVAETISAKDASANPRVQFIRRQIEIASEGQ